MTAFNDDDQYYLFWHQIQLNLVVLGLSTTLQRSRALGIAQLSNDEIQEPPEIENARTNLLQQNENASYSNFRLFNGQTVSEHLRPATIESHLRTPPLYIFT